MISSTMRVTIAAGVLAVAVLSAQAPSPLVIVAYGDTRFTERSNTTATNPRARTALVERIDAEHPDAILVSGDLPWHGNVHDYVRFTAETEVWRRHQLRLL